MDELRLPTARHRGVPLIGAGGLSDRLLAPQPPFRSIERDQRHGAVTMRVAEAERSLVRPLLGISTDTPKRLFVEGVKHSLISFETVGRLSGDDMYKVSRTAAAWRLVQMTREPCALVMTRDGAIEWVARSDSFRHWIPERGQPVGKGSVAAAIIRGEASSDAGEEVDPGEWLDGSSFDDIAVFESANPVPSQDQVVSLVWVRQQDSSEMEDDDWSYS